MQVAARLFRKRGYAATSMRDIATELGIEAPSLYNHISGKPQLIEELLMTVAEAFTAGMAVIRSSGISSIEQLERIVILHVDITIDYTDAISLLTNEWVHLEGEVERKFISMKDRYEQDFREVLTDCVREGSIPEVNVELALFSMLSTLRWLYSWYGRNRTVDRAVLEREMVRLLVPR